MIKKAQQLRYKGPPIVVEDEDEEEYESEEEEEEDDNDSGILYAEEV